MIAWRRHGRKRGHGRRRGLERRRRAGLLGLAWVSTLALGLGGYVAEHSVAPGPVAVLVAAPLMAPFALPLSLAHQFGLRPGAGALLPLISVYWGLVLWLHLRAMTGPIRWLPLTVSALMLSGAGWLVNAEALLLSS